MGIRDQKGNVISLQLFSLVCGRPGEDCTLTGFLLNMKKDSARWVRKRVNLWTRMFSISSACFILMLTRTLFTLDSMSTFSFSFLATVRGLRMSSGEVPASISGTLCRSDVWEAKLESDRAAVSVVRTHCR